MKILTKQNVTEILIKRYLKLLEEYYFYDEKLRLEICTNVVNQMVEEVYDLSIEKIDLLSVQETYIYRKNFGLFDNGVRQPKDKIGNDLNMNKGQIELISKSINERVIKKMIKQIKMNLKLNKNDLVNLPIEHLELSKKSYYLLKRHKINYIIDLISLSIHELSCFKNLKETEKKEIINEIHKLGLNFRDEVENTNDFETINITKEENIIRNHQKINELNKEINELRQIQMQLINEKREIENRRIAINEELEKQSSKIRKLERVRRGIEEKYN